MIKIENETFTKGYVGLSEISKIYKGQTVVYEKSTPTQKVGVKFSTLHGGLCDIGVTVNAGATAPTLQYSWNNGNTWLNWDGSPVGINLGNDLWVRGTNGAVNGEWCFTITPRQDQFQGVKVSGDVNALLNEVGGQISDFPANAFKGLFSGCQHLVDASELELPQSALTEYCYSHMFYGCTDLIYAPELNSTLTIRHCYEYMFAGCTSLLETPSLPSKVSAGWAYQYMFDGCTSLIKVNTIRATTYGSYMCQYMFRNCTSLQTVTIRCSTVSTYSCYGMFSGCTSLRTVTGTSTTFSTMNSTNGYNCAYMFENCSALTSVPNLLATATQKYCYRNMFYGCTSLVNAPQISATALTERCYYCMFYQCTSLTTAPVLPATTLVSYCYAYMFWGCTSLTTAPVLPATKLVSYCYRNMFGHCTSLNYIEVYFDTWGTDNTVSWVYQVASTGTFKKYASLSNSRGQSYIPNGWVIEEISNNTFEIDGTEYDYDDGLAYMNAHGGHVKLLKDLALSDNMAIGSETAEIYFDLNGHDINEGTYYISIIGSKKVHLGNKYGNAQSVIQGTGTYSITLQDGTSPYLVFDDGTDLGGEVCIYNQGGTTSVRALRVFNSAHNAVCEVRSSNLSVIATGTGYAATTNWGHLIVSGAAEFCSTQRYAIYLSTGGKCTISNGSYFCGSSYSPLYFYTSGSGDQELRITGGKFYTGSASGGCITGGSASIYGPFIKELSGGWFGNGAGGTALGTTAQSKITSGYSYQYDATGTTIRVHAKPDDHYTNTLHYKIDITS